ncbi:MAG: hypothetical protein AB1631_13555 [Acidobacteriota bacterium]
MAEPPASLFMRGKHESVLRNSALAPKAQREGSQTCNVWLQGFDVAL